MHAVGKIILSEVSLQPVVTGGIVKNENQEIGRARLLTAVKSLPQTLSPSQLHCTLFQVSLS